MKKPVVVVAGLSMLAIMIIASCTKNYTSSGTISVPMPINQLFAGLRTTPQSINVTAGRDTVVYGAQGTRLHFYVNSFKDATGHILTTGTVNLQLTEMYKSGDMIANHTTTMANGQILQSGGQISMTATMNGQTVSANTYGLGFKRATPAIAPMAIFYGGTANSDSITTWTQADTTGIGVAAEATIQLMDTTGGSATAWQGYLFDSCTNFTFANCDWFYNTDSSEVPVSVVLPDTSFNSSNTQVYLVLPNVNRWGGTADTFTAVLSSDQGYGGNNYSAATNTMKIISEGNFNIVPAGLQYELVVITIKNGQYYYWQITGTVPHAGISATAVMAPDTHADVMTKLQAL